jgi:L-lactate dehydrogenase
MATSVSSPCRCGAGPICDAVPVDGAHIGIVGVGHVGMAAAAALFHAQVVTRLTLVDLDHRRAEGEAMDLMHGQALVGPCTVEAGTAEDLADAAVVVVTAGVSQQPGETRLDLLGRNVEVFRGIVADLDRWAPEAVVIVATNPVDVMTWAARRLSSRPPSRVVGTGTVLDSARLRALLGRRYGVDPQSVHGYVLGEHGDTEFVPWSLVSIGGTSIHRSEVLGVPWDDRTAASIEHEVRRAAYEIIDRKGWTNWAIGSVIRELVAIVLRDERSIVPVSVPGEAAGLDAPSLSVPARLGRSGIDAVIVPPLNEAEHTALRASGAALQGVVADLDL